MSDRPVTLIETPAAEPPAPTYEMPARYPETPAPAAPRKHFFPWATFAVLGLIGVRLFYGVSFFVSIPVALVLVFCGVLIRTARNQGPLSLVFHDVPPDDPALPADVRTEVARAADELAAAGFTPVGVARGVVREGKPFVCTVAADDPRTGIRAVATIAEPNGRKPARRSALTFVTWLRDGGSIMTQWEAHVAVLHAPGTVLLPTTRAAAELYRAHLHRHARAEAAREHPSGTAAERAAASNARAMELMWRNGWLRPHPDGSPRFSTRAVVAMVLGMLPPGRWLVYLLRRLDERAFLALARASG